MRKQDVKEVLNVGIPVYRPVPLYIDGLADNCFIKKIDTYASLRELKSKSVTLIKDITGYTSQKGSTTIVNKIEFNTSREDSVSSFRLDYKRKIMNLYQELVEKQNINSDRLSAEELNRFLMELSNLETEEDEEKFIENYAKLLRHFNHKTDYLRNNGKSGAAIDYYIYQCDYYNAVNENIDKILDIDLSKELDDYLSTLDIEKTVLYMAYTYLEYMEYLLLNNNILLATELSFFIDGFIKNKENRSIRGYINGKYVRYEDIKIKYDYLKKQYRLKNIHLTRRLFEGNSFEENINIINSILNMKSITTTKTIIKPDVNTNETKGNNCGTRTTTKPSERELEELNNFIEERYYEYLKHNPILQVEGEGYLNNYIAFLYENGIMPADRLNNYTRLSQTKSDRAFIFSVDNFDDLIGSTKDELRLHPDITAMNHTDTFNERMDKVITQETSEEQHEKAKQYVLSHGVNK